MNSPSAPCRPFAPAARSRRRPIGIALGVAALAVSTASISLAQQPPADDKGKARVVQRRGPEVDVRAAGGGHIVVLFPHAAAQGQPNGKGVEIVLVESQLPPAPAPGQPAAPGGPMPTGREFVFNSADARDQTVSFKLDTNGNARKLMMLAKVDGKEAEVRAAGGPEGVQIFTVAMPEAPKPPTPEGQPAPAEGQPPAAPPAPPAQAAVLVLYTGGTATQ